VKFRRRRETTHDTWRSGKLREQQVERSNPGVEAANDEVGWQTGTAGLSGLARLARTSAWGLIASGPVLGVAALLGSSAPAEGRPMAAPAHKAVSERSPAGFAQLYVAAYLEAGHGTERSLAAYFSGSVTLTNDPGTRSATRTVAVASRQVQPGYWSVTVAAQVARKNAKGAWVDVGLQYYQVPVQVLGPASAGGAGRPGAAELGYISTALPAQVAAPASLNASNLGYGTNRGNNPADPATQTVSGFLGAYLTGDGALDRYTSPGVALRPVAPAPYTGVEITDIADDSGNASSTAVPADGARRRVLATVTAKDGSGASYPLNYALTLRSRGGRWEVAALDAAPQLQGGSRPSLASPSPSSDGTSSASPSAP
jgi:hypothetical protein